MILMSENRNLLNPLHGILKPEGHLGIAVPRLGRLGGLWEIQPLNVVSNLRLGVLGPPLRPSFRNIAPACLEANGSKNQCSQDSVTEPLAGPPAWQQRRNKS